MAIPAKLSDILSGMEFQGDEHSSYLDVQAGKVVTVSDEEFRAAEEEDIDEASEEDRAAFPRPDWEDEAIELARRVLQDDQQLFLPLPTRFEINEYQIMEAFCLSQDDPRVCGRLRQAIQGRGAFRRFKDEIHDLGIAEPWYRYRDEAYKQIALRWCEDHEIAYVDDLPTPQREEPASRKQRLYRELLEQVRAVLAGERDPTANAANVAALLYHGLPNVSWAGFYLLRQGELVLGPFQGKPACTRIALGKGVCGTAAQRRESVVVPDVHQFPGHIACDTASEAEIVVPLVHQGRLLGVLDLDSPVPGRFDEEDRLGLEAIVGVLVEGTDWSAAAVPRE
jgi:GAF domain-containing protein